MKKTTTDFVAAADKQPRPRKPITLAFADLPDDALVDSHECDAVSGIKKSQRHKLIKEGKFPVPVVLSTRCARHRVGELRRWLADPLGYKNAVSKAAK